MSWSGIGVFIEQDEGVVEETSLEILARARELGNQYNLDVIAFLLADKARELAEKISRHGASKIVYVDNPLFRTYLTDIFTETMYRLVNKYRPRYLLFPATRDSRDLAGRLAIKLRTCLLAHVISIDIDPSTMRMNAAVPGFGGSIAAVCECITMPEMATVTPGVFTPRIFENLRAELIDETEISKDLSTSIRKINRVRMPRQDVSKAERVVIAGAGCLQDLDTVKNFAKEIGAEFAVTRPVADAGLAPRDLQVGSTGITLKSKIAIVLGASGAPHFVSGIRDCGYVISVNIDPEAPIKEYSDLFVVGDLYELIKKLLAKLRG
ncbi:MAG: electron transfer flavoprotein subunit alpha/FixB family protein [Sulfolobales archaeon]